MTTEEELKLRNEQLGNLIERKSIITALVYTIAAITRRGAMQLTQQERDFWIGSAEHLTAEDLLRLLLNNPQDQSQKGQDDVAVC